jgi:hypothetical protein
MTEISTHVQKLFSDMDERWRQAEARSGRRYLTPADAPAIIDRLSQPKERESIMARTTRKPAETAAKTTRKPAAKRTAKAKPAAKRTAKPATAAPAAKRAKARTRTEAESLKLGKTIAARMKKGETMGAVAADLKLYPFQAHQLLAAVHVANGDVDKIAGKTDDVVLKRLIAAREKADKYSSFDYLQARSGINKAKIRKMFTEAGRTDLLTDIRQSAGRQKAKASRATARKTAARGARRTPVAAKAKSTRTRATAAKAQAKAETPKPVSRRRAAANGRKVREAAKSPDAFDAKAAIDKGAKPARKLRGAAAVSAKYKTSAGREPAPPKRRRKPVNVPKGARPSAADPS